MSRHKLSGTLTKDTACKQAIGPSDLFAYSSSRCGKCEMIGTVTKHYDFYLSILHMLLLKDVFGIIQGYVFRNDELAQSIFVPSMSFI